jgi:hypothetical protein
MLLCGIHIELSLLKLIGDWLDGSGWVSVMATAKVTTEGRADAPQKGSHILRGPWEHQVTVAALFTLQTLHTSFSYRKYPLIP